MEMSQCCGIKQYIQTEKLQQIGQICTLIDVAIPADRNVVQKGSEIKVKIQEFMYRDTANVEPEMCGYTGNDWSHWNSNEKLKEKFGTCTGKTLDGFTTKDSCTWNTTHNTESTAV
jgi:hypothetical protein